MKNCFASFAVCIAGALLSINASAQANTEYFIKKQLIGEWRNTFVRVVMHTVSNSDSTVTMQADSTNWEQVLKIKPIRTHFKSDGTYFSEYRNLNDSIVRQPAGTWSVTGDSLTMVQLTPYKSVLKVRVNIVNNRATFSGLIDFDGDGKTDDEYYGTQKKHS